MYNLGSKIKDYFPCERCEKMPTYVFTFRPRHGKRNQHNPNFNTSQNLMFVSFTKFCVPYSTSVSVMPFSLAYSVTLPLKKRRSRTRTSA